MIQNLIIALVAIPLMILLWAVVQQKWGSSFIEMHGDEDVLALRETCGHCGQKDECFRRTESINNRNQSDCRESVKRQEKHHG